MISTVMFYTQNMRKEKQILELCRNLSIRTRKLKQADINVTVGTLSGNGMIKNQDNKKAPTDYKMPELIIFSGLTEEKLDEFLAEYKNAGIETIGLKAVVTVHNASWSIYELTEELIRERTSMLFGEK